MKKISAGKKLFLSVTGIFLLFAVAFIAFQHQRERQYKMDSITQSLQSYNVAMAGTLRMLGKWDETTLTRYIKGHPMEGLRVTVIRKDGKVIFDSEKRLCQFHEPRQPSRDSGSQEERRQLFRREGKQYAQPGVLLFGHLFRQGRNIYPFCPTL